LFPGRSRLTLLPAIHAATGVLMLANGLGFLALLSLLGLLLGDDRRRRDDPTDDVFFWLRYRTR
jgi:4-amino-4-deoxy-L-arabinose transferase-like glycosyltransferase